MVFLHHPSSKFLPSIPTHQFTVSKISLESVVWVLILPPGSSWPGLPWLASGHEKHELPNAHHAMALMRLKLMQEVQEVQVVQDAPLILLGLWLFDLCNRRCPISFHVSFGFQQCLHRKFQLYHQLTNCPNQIR